MAIDGYGLDGDNGSADGAFGHVMSLAAKLVEEWFEQDVPDEEPAIMGLIAALQALAATDPQTAGCVIPHFRTKKWKAAFNDFCEKYEKKVKVKRGVDRKQIREAALAQFDLLMKTVDG